MTQIIHGERIGKQGKIRLGCSAALFDDAGRVLLTKRNDNGQWCLPSGAVDPGESAAEACIREVVEETGLRVEVKRLVGVYSDPNKIIMYADGNKFQIVALHFECEIVGGELGLSDETSDYGYFTLTQIEELDMLLNHKQRIMDTQANQREAFVR